MSEKQTWSIIIFAFNEEKSIAGVIDSAKNILSLLSPSTNQLIIVDDGSTDQTTEIIKSKMEQYPNLVVEFHSENKGIGEALLSGYKLSNMTNVCAVPADGQFNMDELIPFANVPEQSIISFYRLKKTRYNWYRKFLSYCNRILNRHILKIRIRDVNWIKVYKTEFFNEIKPVLTSSLVESEICAKMLRNNYKIIEVPSEYHPRAGGESKGSSLQIVIKAIRETIKLYFVLRKV